MIGETRGFKHFEVIASEKNNVRYALVNGKEEIITIFLPIRYIAEKYFFDVESF